jgi:hypothetical protein
MLIQCCVLTLRAPDPPVSHVAGSVKPVAAKPLTCEGHCGQLREETTEPSLELKRVSLKLKKSLLNSTGSLGKPSPGAGGRSTPARVGPHAGRRRARAWSRGAAAATAAPPAPASSASQSCENRHPLFKFRNNAQLAASISHVALIGPY